MPHCSAKRHKKSYCNLNKPYGEIIRDKSSGANIVRHKFTGQQEDAETGLMYYGARYYDPYIGNFITPDSLIPEPEYSPSVST